MKAHSTNPDAYIVFFPYLKEQTPGNEDFDPSFLETQSVIVRSELLSLSTSKPKTGEGTWTCTVGSSKNYKSLIKPGCWCMIYVSDESLDDVTGLPPDQNGLKMLGLVKSVRTVESVDPGSGTKVVRYTISGSDFHSVLQTQVYINRTILSHNDPKTKPIQDALVLFREYITTPQTPDQAVRKIFEAVLGKKGDLSALLNNASVTAGGAYAIPSQVVNALNGAPGANSNKFVDSLEMFLQKDLVGKIALQPDIGGMFSAWSLAQTYSHRVLNELYSELLPVNQGSGIVLAPSVVLRAIPFSSPPVPSDVSGSVYEDRDDRINIFDQQTLSMPRYAVPRDDNQTDPDKGVALYTSKEIAEDEIVNLNYGKSDSERFNFFFVMSNVAIDKGLDGLKLYELVKGVSIKSLGDPNSIARHGLRPFITTSEYLTISEDDIKTVNIIVRDLWSRAHLFENGQVTIIGSKQHIPVGTIISFSDRKWIAHVERVDHSYSVAANGIKSYRTTISFVRLQTEKGEPIDLADDSVEHEWDRGVGHSLGEALTNTKKGGG